MKRLLCTLHSVIEVGDDLRLLHASFPDFLLDSLRSVDFFIDVSECHTMLALEYIQAICNPSCTSKLQLQGTFLTFVLCLRIMSLVATLVYFEQARTLERYLGSAIKYCTEAGLSRQLSEGLKSADIIGQYGLFACLVPWKRYPATLTLKKVYAFWR